MSGPFEELESPLRKVKGDLITKSEGKPALLANVKYYGVNTVDEWMKRLSEKKHNKIEIYVPRRNLMLTEGLS